MELHYYILFLIIGFLIGVWTQTKRLQAEIKALKKDSETDELTGIPNARAFKKRLNEEWERSNRLKLPLSIMLLDLDNFKKINSDLGYSAADKILVQTAQFLENETRLTDLVYRYKLGDEFAIIIPGHSKDSLNSLIERLKQNFKKQFDKEFIEKYAFNLSLETCDKHQKDQFPIDLIKRCEQNLMKIKSQK